MRGKKFDEMITSMAFDIAYIDADLDISRHSIMNAIYYSDQKKYSSIGLDDLDMVAAYVANHWLDESGPGRKKDGE